MNYTRKIFLLLIFSLVGILITNAQSTALTNISAKIVHPISIQKLIDMNFGNIATNSLGGTIVLSTSGSRTSTGGITLPVQSGSPSAAEFEVSGEKGYTYSITLSTNTIQLRSEEDPSETLAVSNFITDPIGTGTLNVDGIQRIRIGATLTVEPDQPSGNYISSTPLQITVNYN